MKKYSTKRILVTGGAGFLGSHLCERLLHEGNEVLCFDNFYSGNMENISHLLNNSNFKFLIHDITSPLDVDVDGIYNLACPASPIYYQLDPILTIKTCVYGIINMIEIARKRGIKILQASTSEVYGDPLIHPQSEIYWGNVNPIGIRSCYNEGKRCAEAIMFAYYRQHRVKIKIARIFNTYGPRLHTNDGRVISNFIMQALKDEDITIYGNGKQTRSFCYVDDMIEGFLRLMNSPDDLTGPVNLGNTTEVSILGLAESIIRLTGSRSKIVFNSSQSDDPKRRKPDTTMAKERLGWEAKTSLDEGLLKTIEYFQKMHKETIKS